MRLGLEGRSALAAHQMEEGDRDFVALSWSDDEPPLTYEDAADRMRCTASFWRGWLNQGVFPDHPWRGMLQRSALTLKGLTYAPTGALLAAATTSLPESPGGERNWDYRYSWVRDATFALWALYTLGFDYEANSFFYFIADQIGDGSPLRVLYAVDDGVDLKESTLDHLTGYEDSRPVRIGNDAHDQEQHDIWGGLLHAVHLHTRSGEFLSGVTWDNLERQVECAVERWREPDRGIWENRGEPRHFTSSKIMCWVALDRGALLAETMGNADLVERWRGVADAIKADVLEHGLDERGVFTESYGSSTLDASVLLGVLLGSSHPMIPGCTPPCMRSPTTSLTTAWSCATAWTRPTTALRRGGGDVRDLFVLAGLRARRDRRARRCARPAREAPGWRALSALRGGTGSSDRPPPRELPQAFTHLALIKHDAGDPSRTPWRPSRRSGTELSRRQPDERTRAHESRASPTGSPRGSSPIGSRSCRNAVRVVPELRGPVRRRRA
jgi:hypothetical protein